MSTIQIIILSACSLLFLLFSLLLVAAWYMSSLVIKPPRRSHEEALAYHADKGQIEKNYFSTLKQADWRFRNRQGLGLVGKWIYAHKDEEYEKKEQKKILIYVHGHGHNMMGSVKFLPLFLERGYDVLIYDQINSGNSEGKFTSMGLKEQIDLSDIIDSVHAQFEGKNLLLGLLGESMGAATVLLTAAQKYHLEKEQRKNLKAKGTGQGLEPSINFAIADCSYADLKEQLVFQLKDVYKIGRFPLLQFSSLISYCRSGLSWQDVSPVRELQAADGLPDLPILFVHGLDDTYIPAATSQKLYDAKKGYRHLLYIKGAGHTESVSVDTLSYARSLDELLKQC